MTVSNVTLTGNSADFGGGAIGNFSSGLGIPASLQVIDCTLSGNSAPLPGAVPQFTGVGGGILNQVIQRGGGSVQVISSTLNGNSAATGGGGIYNNVQDSDSFGIVSITNSTLSTSSSYLGGGILNAAFNLARASLLIANSTFSGNEASNPGGGILNTEDTSSPATAHVGNTIFNGGASGGNIGNGGTLISDGYNLSSDNGGGALTNVTDLLNTDPKLGPLQDNGGPTFTHALTCDSPAVNAGDPGFTSPPDFDTRRGLSARLRRSHRHRRLRAANKLQPRTIRPVHQRVCLGRQQLHSRRHD